MANREPWITMDTVYAWSNIRCKHCFEPYNDHAGKKCLYGPAFFEEALCKLCGQVFQHPPVKGQGDALYHPACANQNFVHAVTNSGKKTP